MPQAASLLTPTSSLPPLRNLDSLAEDRLFALLQGLIRIYCPLSFHLDPEDKKEVDDALADSGYTSGVDGDGDGHGEALTALRADGFERAFAERWLTGFLARSEELDFFTSDEARQRAVDEASSVIESFYVNAEVEEQLQEELADYSRDFSFDVTLPDGQAGSKISARLNDGLAGQNSEEPDDVGLQSWGASIVFSQLLCTEPERFNLTKETLPPASRIIDLGAGTGLVSVVLGHLLPQLGMEDTMVVATDYHPAVMDNLHANVAANFTETQQEFVKAATLDWTAPSSEPPLDRKAEMLFATDVVYAAEHAVWLRDCATGYLASGGVFWLLATIRDTGRFDGVSNTVRVAFEAEDRPKGEDGLRLTILTEERLEKRKGIGRGDEAGYKLFRIGWA